MFDVYADNDGLSNSDQMIVFVRKCNSRLDTLRQSANHNAHLNIACLRVDIKCHRCTKRHYVCILMAVFLFIGTSYFYVRFQQLARDLNELRVQIRLLQGKSNKKLNIYRHKGFSSTFTTETTKKVSSDRENADIDDFSDNLPHNRYKEQMKELRLVRQRKERQEIQGFRGRGSFKRKRRSPKRKKDKNAKVRMKLNLRNHSWKLAEWVSQRSQYFDHSNGEILIKKSGFYLMYAQVTLIGSRKRGFYVKKMSRTADGTYVAYIISTCTRFSDEDDSSSGNDSCSVHRPCRLDAGDRLLIEPIFKQDILYSSSYTYFGLIKMG
ncbi:hypothetical protein ACJMK2_019331 [Sinanodonta woodiana]|uniref:THD domain-containing protein n=1 Tax=Sinanodonta woodiana TaxID=1069815 RepID=A0ABD3UK33_SINWO